jgi:hypothetical protein
MKKIIAVALILAALCTHTIVQGDNIEDEVKITVTADKKTTFDMFHDSNGVVKGLTTPYEMKFSRTASHFIFKSRKSKTNLKIKVELNNKTALTAEWPIAVLLITNSSFTTFGM